METEFGGSRFMELKHAANWARVACASRYGLDEINIMDYNNFLIEKEKNPTAADIALHDSIKKAGGYDPIVENNKNLLERTPGNDYLAGKIEKNYKNNYPKTGKIREKLIESDRFDLNFVKSKMTSRSQKFIMKLKSII